MNLTDCEQWPDEREPLPAAVMIALAAELGDGELIDASEDDG
jgi:hypothetical protein